MTRTTRSITWLKITRPSRVWPRSSLTLHWWRVADANGNDPSGYPAALWAQQYAAATPEYLTFDYRTAATYGLQPNQSLTLRSENATSSIFDDFLRDDPVLPPSSVTSAQFDWALDFTANDWRQLASSINGIGTFHGRPDVFITNAREGRIHRLLSF